jgi:hypothetical protein
MCASIAEKARAPLCAHSCLRDNATAEVVAPVPAPETQARGETVMVVKTTLLCE